MRLIYLYIGIFCLAGAIMAQSHDEEEMVHFEGSANLPTDDEDIVEGSGLPPDVAYTTNPVKPRVTTTPLSTTTTRDQPTTTHPRQTTTVVKQDKIQPQIFTTPSRINTRPKPPIYTVNENGSETGVWYSAGNWVIFGMVLVIIAIFVGIIVIICCCKKQKRYTPAKQVEN